MRAYHPPKRRPFPVVPTPIGRLPINLQRSALYPGREGMVGEAIQAWQTYMDGAPEPVILPQRLAFQQWKTTPDGARRHWLSSTSSLMAVYNGHAMKSGIPVELFNRLRAQHEKQHPPYFPHYAAGAAYGGASLPEQPQYAAPVLERELPTRPTRSIFVGEDNVPAPFPHPSMFVESVLANDARRAHERVARRNQAEAGVRSQLDASVFRRPKVVR
jgi:hypothetical protein